MNRNVMHMDLDTFFVSVERLANSKLIGKPVLVGGNSDRGVVASCSYEARQFGIHSAMPMRMARQLCPQAIVVSGDHEQYSKFSDIITEMVKETVPVYEKSSIDEFYMDLTGMDTFFGCYKVAAELRQRIIKETKLPISFALSSNKTVSKIGTGEAKPNGCKEIPGGEEKVFLAPLSVRKIPMVGEKTYHLLRNMGIEKVKTVQEMPIELMEQVLGENGIVIWRKANGIDNSPVEQYSERKSISTETTFDKDTIDVTNLKALLVGMTEKLAFQLRNEQKLTSCVTVKIRYSDFNTFTMQSRIPYTTLDHVLIEKVKELFDKLYQKRMLIRLIGIRFSHLVHGTYQIDLFNDTIEQLQLYQAMDNMRKRYGKDAVQRAVSMDIRTRDFNPFNGIRNDIVPTRK
ncbi:MAG TPA: DNA polymerase IV [Bacteroidia bacterium]|jgi:DNA polymerase-4|nr:DNA polymerase IV [Bacteroidia bacterium]